MTSGREVDRDPLLKAIATLPAVVPEASHAERVKARCRSRLDAPPAAEVPWESAAIGAICAAYGWQIARLALLLSGLRQP